MHVNIKGRREDEKDLFDLTIRTPGEGPCLPESDGSSYSSAVQQKYMSYRCNLIFFLVAIFTKVKTRVMFILIALLGSTYPKYRPVCSQYVTLSVRHFMFFFYSLKVDVYFPPIAHLHIFFLIKNLNLGGILNVYLDFIKFTDEKADSHISMLFQTYLKVFP